jgi:predicted oxidoreductase (fatty acid repression mutant protein)
MTFCDTVSAMLSEEQMKQTQQRLDGFKAGHGTVLFFDDESVIRQQQEAFKLYADNFPVWANQANVSVSHDSNAIFADSGMASRVWHNWLSGLHLKRKASAVLSRYANAKSTQSSPD